MKEVPRSGKRPARLNLAASAANREAEQAGGQRWWWVSREQSREEREMSARCHVETGLWVQLIGSQRLVAW